MTLSFHFKILQLFFILIKLFKVYNYIFDVCFQLMPELNLKRRITKNIYVLRKCNKPAAIE